MMEQPIIKKLIKDDDDDEKDYILLQPPNICIGEQERRMLLQVILNIVATPSELEAKTLLPLPECKQRLFQTQIEAKKNKPKKELRKFVSATIHENSDVNIDVKPLKRRLSQALLDKMKSEISSTTSRLMPPCKRALPPPASTNIKVRKLSINISGRQKPQLGRPYAKKTVPAAHVISNRDMNTFRKSQLAESQCPDVYVTKESTVTEFQTLFQIMDIAKDFGDIQIKVERDS